MNPTIQLIGIVGLYILTLLYVIIILGIVYAIIEPFNNGKRYLICLLFTVILFLLSCTKDTTFNTCLMCREVDSKYSEYYTEYCNITPEMQSEIDKGLWICKYKYLMP